MFNKILFIGCGNMGSIMLEKFLEFNIFTHHQIKVIKPSKNNQINDIQYYPNVDFIEQGYIANIVFICVKPQDSEEILTKFFERKITDKNTIFISIMAGKNISFLQKIFPKNAKIIRIMPNILIQQNQGIIPYFSNKNTTTNDLNFLNQIFINFASLIPLNQEKLFHAFTAIFASSPAYIFLIAEIMLSIAVKNNIEKSLALKLIQKLFIGSALALDNSSDFVDLRSKVTSKKGTTASAIDQLTKNNSLHKILNKAISQAVKTSKKLS
jgi:pyrroline-5-carboxylate reductase